MKSNLPAVKQKIKPTVYFVVEVDISCWSPKNILHAQSNHVLNAGLIRKHLKTFDSLAELTGRSLNAKRLEDNRMKVIGHPKDANIARYCFPYSLEPDTHSAGLALAGILKTNLRKSLSNDADLAKRLTIRDSAYARPKPARRLIAGHTTPEEAEEMSKPVPGELMRWLDPKMEALHPETRIESMDGTTATCVDRNEDTIVVNIPSGMV